MNKGRLKIQSTGTKPIFIVKVPKDKFIEPEIMADLRKQLNDYHVLFVSAKVEEYAFECFLATEYDKERIECLNKPNVYPARVTFDNGNSRIVHNDEDCKLLEKLVYGRTNKTTN